jgi:ABC-type dipeptide/oligopeptide/nickel transport system permease component
VLASRGAVLFQQRLFGHFMTQLFRKQLAIAIFPVLLLAAISTAWTTRLSEQHMIEQLRRAWRSKASCKRRESARF